MIALLIAVLMCPPNAPRDITAVRHFMKANPCPAGPDKGNTSTCEGYVVDHVVPLCIGGKNDPSNMQWQELAISKQKDNAEVGLCVWYYRACGWKW